MSQIFNAGDGPSGPAIDTKNFMRASLVHDALYQLMRLGTLDKSRRQYADRLLQTIRRSGKQKTGYSSTMIDCKIEGCIYNFDHKCRDDSKVITLYEHMDRLVFRCDKMKFPVKLDHVNGIKPIR